MGIQRRKLGKLPLLDFAIYAPKSVIIEFLTKLIPTIRSPPNPTVKLDFGGQFWVLLL